VTALCWKKVPKLIIMKIPLRSYISVFTGYADDCGKDVEQELTAGN
jgi:hypothetical protein